MPRLQFNVLSLILVIALGAASSQLTAAPPDAKDAAAAAIRQRAKEYLQAVECGDGEAIASFWTSDGDYLDETGNAIKGRQLALAAKARSKELGEARQLAAAAESLRFVTSDVAIEDGAVCNPQGPTGDAVVRRYTAIWVRKDGTWLLDGVRELAAPAISGRNPLQDLAWMIGEWASDDDGNSIRLKCTWSDDEHFLLREIDVNLSERGPLHVSQRIGWDARDRQIKSWTFDSQGGHGAGLWFRQAERWIVEAESILPNGSRSTGTNVYALHKTDTFTWQTTNAEIDGEAIPDRSVQMVRQKASDGR